MRVLLLCLLAFSTVCSYAQSTIADARNKAIGSVVTVSGIITNGDELGSIRYLQDTTAGIAIYDDQLSQVKRGDSITVTGKLDDYSNLLEIKDLSAYTKHSSDHPMPAPMVVSIDEIGEDYEGQLLQINNIQIEKAGEIFAGNENYDFTDGSETGELRINNNSPIVGKAIPSGSINLVAICSQYSWESNDTRNGYQVLPRDMNDFESNSKVQITSPVSVVGLSKSSLSLQWETNTGATPFVRYGSSMDESALTNIKQGDSTTGEVNTHRIELTGLGSSELLYAQVFSVLEGDTAFSGIGAYITESNSTGKINIYFNSSIDESLASETVAHDIGNAMEDTLAAYINLAEESLDLCIYNFNNTTISDAINDAHNRGVSIRIVTCESTSHYSIDDLDAAIPVIERPEIQQGGIMHNKFAIIDAEHTNANKAWVWSGSTNLTQGQLFTDANNMIFIQDQSLARTYKIEFEEMWGSNTNAPNVANAKFGDEKTNNTPHLLAIGGNWVECYFSPSDNTNQQLINAMETADNDLNVQTMLITRSDLAYAIADANRRGVKTHVITDKESTNSETVNNTLNDELPDGKFIFDSDASGTLHHKLAIIDANYPDSDPMVVSGSHNWSNSANDRNDENTLIIHSADIANQYFQQFAHRFEENDGDLIVSANKIQLTGIKIYPNPTDGRIRISATEDLTCIQLYSLHGNLIRQITPGQKQSTELDLSGKKSGIYLLKIEGRNNAVNTYKIIKR